MKRKLIVGVLLITLCLLITGCGKKESSEKELFDKEFKIICDRTSSLDLDNPDGTQFRGSIDSTRVSSVNKSGLVYSVKETSVYHCGDDYTFDTLSDTARSKTDDDEVTFDEDNRIITIVSVFSRDPSKYTKEDKEILYVTEFFKSEEDDGYTCSYKGITEEEVLNAK